MKGLRVDSSLGDVEPWECWGFEMCSDPDSEVDRNVKARSAFWLNPADIWFRLGGSFFCLWLIGFGTHLRVD